TRPGGWRDCASCRLGRLWRLRSLWIYITHVRFFFFLFPFLFFLGLGGCLRHPLIPPPYPAIDDMNTIRPHRCAFMCSTTPLTRINDARRLTVMV
ncbi:hypothetical protein T310_9018, partial [Rasamsonia emersonii CBS 393.64]